MNRAEATPGAAEPLLPSPPRPLSFREVTVGALEMYRRHFGTMFGTSLVFAAATAVIVGAMPLAMGGPPDSVKGYGAAGVAGALLTGVSLLPWWAALGRQGWNACTGGEVSLRDGLRGARDAFSRLLVVYLVYMPAYFLGLALFIVPGLLVATVFFAKVHAVVVEDRSALGALRRSAGLVRGGFLPVLALQVLAWGLDRLMDNAWGGLGALAAGGAGASLGVRVPAFGSAWAEALSSAGQVGVTALTTPLVMAATTLLYYDRRVRTELPAAALADSAATPAA